MFDIVALGETLIDFTPAGTNEQGMALLARNPGGAPANVLAMNARLGGKTAFIGKVGKDAFGNFLRKSMADCGIDTRGLVADDKLHTTLAFVQLDEQGDRSFTFYRDLGADIMLQSHEVSKRLIDEGEVFHFGSVSLTADPCRSATLEAARYAKEKGKIISFDPNYRPHLWAEQGQAVGWIKQGVQLADILKISQEEMQLLTGENDPEEAARRLMNMGPKLVLISMGAKGAFYKNSVCSGFVPAFDVKTVDTTGAGDAFLGAVLYLLRDRTVQEIAALPQEAMQGIVQFGNAAGSLTTRKCGAIPAMPSKEEIENCLHTGRLLNA